MNSLSDDSLSVSISILLDGCDVGVRPQDLQVNIGEDSSETVDDVPFVRHLGLGTDLTGNGGDTSKTASVVLEGHYVTSGNCVLSLLDRGVGGGGSENWENAEDESDESLGEHGGGSKSRNFDSDE